MNPSGLAHTTEGSGRSPGLAVLPLEEFPRILSSLSFTPPHEPPFNSYSLQVGDKDVPARFRFDPVQPVLYLPTEIGCKGACGFCVFRDHFGGDLTGEKILELAHRIMTDVAQEPGRARIEFTEMGDAGYNPTNVLAAVGHLAASFGRLEVCSSAPAPAPTPLAQSIEEMYEPWVSALARLPNFYLRISLHHSNDEHRNRLMKPSPGTPMLNLDQIAALGERVFAEAHRPLWLNYMVLPGKNDRVENVAELTRRFSAEKYVLALSPYDAPQPLTEKEYLAKVDAVARFEGLLSHGGYTFERRFSAGWTVGQGNGRHVGPNGSASLFSHVSSERLSSPV